MKFVKFLKLLNKKIEKYNAATTNPFDAARNWTIVWVENSSSYPQKEKF